MEMHRPYLATPLYVLILVKYTETVVNDQNRINIPFGVIVFAMPNKEFLPITKAAIVNVPALASVLSPPNGPTPPPPPPPPPSSPGGSTIAATEHGSCKFEEFCVTTDGKAKLSLKCGDIEIQASSDGAKISTSSGPIEVGVNFTK
jgi:hypothetical protein